MALTRLVQGVHREVWEKTDAQAGGTSVVVSTGIRISPQQLCRVSGILAVVLPTGAPYFNQPTLSIVNGLLTISISNTAGGGGANAATWMLDIRLIQSPSQVNRGAAGYIMVCNGATSGLAAPQTLAQTYAIGAIQSDQTLVLANADNPGTVGIILDGSTAAVTSVGVSLEVRQNDVFEIPMSVSRRVGSAAGPNLQFDKARGTYAAPADVQAGDQLGVIDFYGRVGGAPVLGARLSSTAIDVAGGLDAGIDLAGTTNGAFNLMVRFDVRGPGPVPEMILYGNGYIVPSANNQGHIGIAGNIWQTLTVYTANVFANVSLGGGAVGGGANLTVMLTNTATMPVPQANQVYLGSNDFTQAGSLAALAISAEEPPAAVGAYVVDTVLPCIYNGRFFYLHATELGVG